MSPRTLKIILALSVALNLFVVAGAIGAWTRWRAVETQVEEVRRPPRGGPMMAVLEQVAPETRVRVRQTLRASALAARPDFEAARQSRREAMDLARREPFDAAAVSALLQQSREAELRGRARLEADSVAMLATLEPADREALAPLLTRAGKRGRGGRGGRDRSRAEARPETATR